MADWFVYQQDLYPNDLDPDSLGVSLLPVFDSSKHVVYRDGSSYNGLRRVKSYWGVDRDVVQFDMFVHSTHIPRAGLPPLHSSPSMVTHIVHWLPQQHQFQFANSTNGFHFENVTQQQCLVLTRDANNQSHAKLCQKDALGHYTVQTGSVMIVRVHKLTMLAPLSLDTTMFSKFVTAHTQMGSTDASMK